MLGVLQRPRRLVGNGRHLAVHVEQLALVEPETFDDVLEGVGVHGLLEGLPQQILPAFRIGEMAVDRQHDVVGDEAFGGREEAEVALDGAAFVLGEAVARFPQGDIGLHRDFGRHPVIVAAGEVFLPRPFVFQRQQLIDVGAAIDHPLVVDGHPAAVAIDGAEAGLIGPGNWLRREWRQCLMSGCTWFRPVEHCRFLLFLLLTGRLRIRDCRSSTPPHRIDPARWQPARR